MRPKHLSRGFTLLEMSIVLVIIGLLVGAIIVGQSMVRASEINAVASDIQKYRSAFASFRLKYNYWPGDLPTAYDYWPSAGCSNALAISPANTGCNGNGDGKIDAWSSGATPVQNEIYRAWQHLAQSGIIAGNFTGVPGPSSSGDDVIETNVPGTKISGVGIRITAPITVATDTTSMFAGDYPNSFSVGRDSTTFGDTNGSIYREFMTPTEAQSVDAKYDDGKPASGKYRGRPSGANPGCTTTDVSATALYNLTNTAPGCSVRVDIE